MKNRTAKIINCLAVCIACTVMNVMAQTWDCGFPNAADVTATLDADGTMTIRGTGKMADYAWWDGIHPPWDQVKEEIRSVIIEEGVTSIGDCAFSFVNLEDLSIGNTVEHIGIGAFDGCSISFVMIPDGVKTIGDKAFAFGVIKYLVIPESVSNIEYAAFESIRELEKISVSWNDPADVICKWDIFYDIDKSSVILHVPVGTKAAYQADDVWKDFNIVDDVIDLHLLSDLTANVATLSPKFVPQWHHYRITVPQSISNIILTATPAEGATVSGDGQKALITGENTIIIEVTSSQGSCTYTVIVTRLATDFSLEFVRSVERVTGALTTTYFNVVTNRNETVSLIDLFELSYVLTNAGHSGDIELRFDIGTTTQNKTISVEPNSIYNVTLSLRIGSYPTGSITFTVNYEPVTGTPTSVTLNYGRYSRDVIASLGDEVLSTETIRFTGFGFSNVSADLTFVENGNLTTCTVAFDPQGGSDIITATVLTGGNATQPANPTREGYTFAGWYKEAACTNAWNFANDVVTADVTLYAKWISDSSPSFTVTFDSQGGSAVQSQIVEDGGTATQPANPTQDGFTFAGWFKEAACTNVWSFANDAVTADVTLFAKWISNSITTYTVTFDPQGGNAVTPQTIAQGEKVTQPADPEREGYTFGGWFKEAACTNVWNFSTDAVDSDVTIYAKWTENTRTGVESPEAPLARIYPNPTDGAVTLEFETQAEYIVTISDTTGKILFIQTVNDPIARLDISNYPAGVYLLTINDGKRRSTMRVLKIQ